MKSTLLSRFSPSLLPQQLAYQVGNIESHVIVPAEKVGTGQGAAGDDGGSRRGAPFRFGHLMDDGVEGEEMDSSLSLSLARRRFLSRCPLRATEKALACPVC